MNQEWTREQILALPTCRDMDVLVEQYVFGKKIRWMQDEWSDPVPVSGDHGYIIDQYSTDLLAAWEVLEKLRKDTCFINVYPWNNGYHVHSSTHEIGLVKASTAPEAISKAALLAVMGL